MHPLLQKIPRLLRFLLLVTLLNLGLLLLLRVAFWFIFSNSADPAPAGDTWRAFYLGSKFDLQLILVSIAPMFVLAGLRWFCPFRSLRMRFVWTGYLTLVMAAVLFVYAVDFGHYAYLSTRVNATVLRFLENFDISMQMVWQTYNVVSWSLLLLAVIGGYAWWLFRTLNNISRQPAATLSWRGKWLAGILGTLLLLLGIYGSYTYPYVNLAIVFLLLLTVLHPLRARLFDRFTNWSRYLRSAATIGVMLGITAMAGVIVNYAFRFEYYPLRWSAAFFSPHAFSSAIACNPAIYFTNTFKNRKTAFDVAATQKAYPLIRELLHIPEADPGKLEYRREVTTTQAITTRPNVILVFLESFASYKTTTFGNPLNPTPEFDKLANNGMLFTNYYTPLTGTARSVFAAVTGLPDIELNETATRNPLIINQHTIINDYQGYEKFYFIGGSASWGNIRGLLSFNITNLHLYEEGNYTSPRMDVWGIDDLSLFAESNQVLRQQTKPFLAIIQTSGNHRPYNIPADNHGFELKTAEDAMLRKHGFIDNDEFNSFRFMDHSIAHFMKLAAEEKYFDNTVFVFFGDHGIPGNGGEHTPAFRSQHELTALHVPLLIYAPKLVKPQRIDKLASELDLLPTVAGLTLPRYTNTTLGRDLRDTRYDKQRVAFTMMDHTIGLLEGQYYFRHNTVTGEKMLFDSLNADSRANVAAQQSVIAAQMDALCSGMFETTKYMMYHNRNGAVQSAEKSP